MLREVFLMLNGLVVATSVAHPGLSVAKRLSMVISMTSQLAPP